MANTPNVRSGSSAARVRIGALAELARYIGSDESTQSWLTKTEAAWLLASIAEYDRVRGFPRDMVGWEDVEIALRAVLDDDNAVDAAMCLKNLDWIVVRDA